MKSRAHAGVPVNADRPPDPTCNPLGILGYPCTPWCANTRSPVGAATSENTSFSVDVFKMASGLSPGKGSGYACHVPPGRRLRSFGDPLPAFSAPFPAFSLWMGKDPQYPDTLNDLRSQGSNRHPPPGVCWPPPRLSRNVCICLPSLAARLPPTTWHPTVQVWGPAKGPAATAIRPQGRPI